MTANNRLYELAKLFSDNIWGGVVKVPEVIDYTYSAKNYPDEKIFTNFILYKSEIKNSNLLLQLEEHTTDNTIFYVVKFYLTREDELSRLNKWDMSIFFDKIISFKVYSDKINLVYSENIYADEITGLCEEIYNYIHIYMTTCRGLSQEDLDKESEKLSNYTQNYT